MAVFDRQIPYEVLIRFDASGELAGAHYVARRVVTIDGEVVRDEVQPPAPVRLAEGAEIQSGAPEAASVLQDVLGAATLQALSSADRLAAELASGRAQLEDAEARAARADQLEAQLAHLQQQLAAAGS